MRRLISLLIFLALVFLFLYQPSEAGVNPFKASASTGSNFLSVANKPAAAME